METPKQIVDKIRKLKALQEGAKKVGSIEESEAAAMAINKLLTKYNLSLFDIEDAAEKKTTTRIKTSPTLSIKNVYGTVWKKALLRTLCEYNYCDVLGYSQGVVVVGVEVNIMTVIDLYNTLQSVYLHSAKENYEQNKNTLVGGQRTEKYRRRYISSFLVGCAHGLYEKLSSIKTDECTAVALCSKTLINEYISANYKIKTVAPIRKKLYDSAHRMGLVKGQTTELRKTVAQPAHADGRGIEE